MSQSPHQSILAQTGRAPWKREVPDSPELRRILAIPRRDWTDKEAEELAEVMTELLKKPAGTMSLRPFQAVALHDLAAYGGLVGMGRVGCGKTLLSFLAPYVCEAHRPLLIIPANLREKTRKDLQYYRQHFEVSNMLAIESYEMMARSNYASYLEAHRPDLIICDEAHHLRNTRASVTRRIKRYLEKCAHDTTGFYKRPKIVLLSGTFSNRSVREYWHLLKWVLPRERVPLPLELSELETWSCALDEKVRPGTRIHPGKLVQLCNKEELQMFQEGKALPACRRAYGRRLVETPGVVSTRETFSGSRLTVKDIRLNPPDVVKASFHILRAAWELPDGQPISDGMVLAKVAKELALGFYYKWDPWPPEQWLEARKDWCKFVRKVLANNKRDLDTEAQVIDAVLEGHYPPDALAAWAKVKDTFEIKVTPVWLDDFAVDAAADWMAKHAGIVWVYHTAFGERLSKKTGVKYYGEGGFSQDGSFIENHPANQPLIASITANKEGKNLQNWHRNLVVHPPSSGSWWEQMIGRTHRDGQLADEVIVEMFGSCIEHYQAFYRAVADSIYVQDSTPMVQKLLYADVEVPSLEDVEAEIGDLWSPTKIRVG